PAVEGIVLFKIAGRSISGWIPGLKTGTASHVRQPFCFTAFELSLWLLPLTAFYLLAAYLLLRRAVALWLFRERTCSHGTPAERRFQIVKSGCHARCFITARRHHQPLSPRRPRTFRADHRLHLVPGPCPGRRQLRVFPG